MAEDVFSEWFGAQKPAEAEQDAPPPTAVGHGQASPASINEVTEAAAGAPECVTVNADWDEPSEPAEPTRLALALTMAARGFRVFPLEPGSKEPVKGSSWKAEATTDPVKIRAWWAFEPNYNYAVAAGEGTLIVDVDAAKGGYASLLDLDLPDTLTVKTPGGGMHRYYAGPDVQNSVDRIAPGIDIRSAGGYVVGPGSYFADPGGKKGYTGDYYVINDTAPVAAPEALVLKCGEPKQRDENRAPVSSDEPDDIRFAIQYLQNDAPLTKLGSGNNTTYAVAARVIEIGASPDKAFELMAEHWNPRLDEPWSNDELKRLIDHAAEYMQGRQGSRGVTAGAAGFGDVVVIEPSAPPPSSGPIFDPWREVIVPELPSGLLPDTIDRFATNQSVVMGACRSAIGFAALSALSGAVNHATSLRMMRNGTWSASPRFWLLLAGPPSSKKTPIIGEALRPLEALQARQWREWKALCDFQGDDEPKPPTPPRLVAGDVTMEALAGVLAGQERGILVKRDEIAGWIGSMEKYGSGRGPMADRAFWLEAFNGGPYTVDRVTRGNIMVPNLSVSIVGGIQPDRLSELQGLQSDGLLQRFLPVFVGPGRVAEDCRSSNTVYADLIEAAAKLGPMRFEFNDAALTIAARFRQRTHDLQLAAETARPGFAQFVGKLDGLFGTFALLFHVAEGVEHWFPERVSSETADRVEALFLDFIMPHAFEFYGYADHAGGTDKLRKVASWVLTAGRERFTARDAMREISCLSGLDAFRIGRELGPLVAGGWLEPETAGPENRAWRVLPTVVQQFEKRREDEERRKQELARLMNGPRRPKE